MKQSAINAKVVLMVFKLDEGYKHKGSATTYSNGSRPSIFKLLNFLSLQNNFFLFHHLPNVDQGVAHPAQCSVDAYPG